jgi:low temperature requirement protein LtrA
MSRSVRVVAALLRGRILSLTLTSHRDAAEEGIRLSEQVQGQGALTDRPERHPSWLELFFDLVFVAAVAALTQQLHADHSLAGLAVFAGLFVPVWWAWRGFAWYATGFDTDDRTFRCALFSGMLGVGALSAGVHGAAHGNSTAFVIAYAGLLSVLAALYAGAWWRSPGVRPLAARQVIGYGLGATLWLASLALGEGARPWIWGAAMLVLIAIPLAVLRQPQRAYDAGHIAERYGLFTIIVLGEAVVGTVAGLDTGGSVAAILVALLGFVVAASIWWVYFGRYRSMPGGGTSARFVRAQMHLLIFVGIAAAAVGVAFAVEAAAGGRALTLADRLPLGAGLAAYLIAMGTIRTVTRHLDGVAIMRLTVAGMVLAAALAGLGLGPLAFVALVTVLLIAEATIEMTRAPPPAGREDDGQSPGVWSMKP